MAHNDTPLDPLTWRLAIRQADMIVRFLADQALANGLINGRIRKANKDRASYAADIADKLWATLKDAPGTVGNAYAFDAKTEAEWPKIPSKSKADLPQHVRIGER